ncbi:NTTRR-F1 domain [Priestia megaterium]|uniref:NTTRR-F1 domain n=1 Tax=Priestia megaterium TaxID=1404 RepID=UPI002E2156E5|nr:NTTRR-F1 domain [Priestia megaterium]
MLIQNLIINGGFERGTLTSWSSANTTVTSQFSHFGSFSARFQSSPFTSYMGQFVPLNPGESMEVLASFAKVGTAPSTPVFIQVTFYDSLSNLLGPGLGTTIPGGQIPTVNNDTWLKIDQTTTPAPPNTTQAFILIYTVPQAGTANVLVDDVALLVAPATGNTGPTGANPPTLAFTEAPGSISIFPPLNTEVIVASITQNVLINQQLKIDYALAVEIVATANWSILFEMRLYRDTTLIDTRIFNRSSTQAGTQRFPLASTQVNVVPATTTSTYSLRIIVTEATAITSATAHNRDLNIITFTP